MVLTIAPLVAICSQASIDFTKRVKWNYCNEAKRSWAIEAKQSGKNQWWLKYIEINLNSTSTKANESWTDAKLSGYWRKYFQGVNSPSCFKENRVEPLDSNCPRTYHPKQFLFPMGSPGSPDTVWISMKASTKSVPIRRSMAPPERCILSETFFKWLYCLTDSLEIVLALLQGLVTVYTWRVFVISSSEGEATVTSIISEGSLFFFPPARFMTGRIMHAL